MRIVYNALECVKCGSVIESKHRHDFVTCKCGAVSVDGGREYLRRMGETGMAIDRSLVTTDDFAKVREKFSRWNPKKVEYIPLKDIDDDWLDNIIVWYLDIPEDKRETQMPHEYLILFIQEKLYRNEKNYDDEE